MPQCRPGRQADKDAVLVQQQAAQQRQHNLHSFRLLTLVTSDNARLTCKIHDALCCTEMSQRKV